MQCDKCLRPAVIYQRYSGLHLCEQHLCMDITAKAKRVVRTYAGLRPGDRIAVNMYRKEKWLCNSQFHALPACRQA